MAAACLCSPINHTLCSPNVNACDLSTGNHCKWYFKCQKFYSVNMKCTWMHGLNFQFDHVVAFCHVIQEESLSSQCLALWTGSNNAVNKGMPLCVFNKKLPTFHSSFKKPVLSLLSKVFRLCWWVLVQNTLNFMYLFITNYSQMHIFIRNISSFTYLSEIKIFAFLKYNLIICKQQCIQGNRFL